MMPVARMDSLYPWRSRSQSFFREGKFLDADEVREALEESAARDGMKIDMLSKFRNADQHFPNLLRMYRSLEPRRFPVSQLRHVTIREHFLNILEEEGFRGSRTPSFVLNGELRDLRVSCWGVDIPPDDIESAKEERFQEFMDKLSEDDVDTYLSWEDMDEVRDMMANSPAFSQHSRYGNFQFSFPIDDLLEEYRTQHCRGGRPVLRVLGTQTYKLEIVHWVLIHSPHCRDFIHLPRVRRRVPLYWAGNQLMWQPESMTDQFNWYISNSTGELEQKPQRYGKSGLMQTYDPWVWNSPVFAFHLPGNTFLQMNRSWLLNNVAACETMDSFGGTVSRTLRHPQEKYVSEQEAEDLINNEKSW